ncbi:response regulator transcription factor [Bradyrhizobium sp.]|uniref:response regulator n=1 Tax=Bradyrhizobium sp. TaxID=376 RepID=UPI002626ECE9|nr:response regulator transcription factor [Bradyrhizobium sp.]
MLEIQTLVHTMRILLIEDNRRLAQSLTRGLRGEGFDLDAFGNAEEGVNAFSALHYDAVVLDLGLPDRDGLDVLGDLRKARNEVPVLILTARDSVESRVMGLDAGADDYLVKPFAMTELAARMRALLRRPGQPLATLLKVGNTELNSAGRQVTIDNKSTHFSLREIKALEILMRREGQVVPKTTLEDNLNGLNKTATQNSIEVLIFRLRRRLGLYGSNCSIHTLHGIGYLIKEN